MGTQLRGQNNTSIVARRREKRERPEQEYVGNVPVGDEHNIRGFATEQNRIGGHIRGTRPDHLQGLSRAA